MNDLELRRKYFEMFERNELPFLECKRCGFRFYYPRIICPRCKSSDIELKVSNGLGKIFAMTRIHKKDGNIITYGIIELSEGFRMYSNIIEDENKKADINESVKVVFIEINKMKYPTFKVI
ncbi:Zn-ribbon domain-containing OB-fold protein [Saccharolobus caldissimus]|uniref:ChsH2 rubredoxin-like zinc ribbon domain-containing protein n=1 Tax=Saccharolobus caldissimus TaxID=1702097 RepID=A0AAQ4CSH0_9CREN|nr:zinc ribbon domain-containing protein [Saccharolobus caldissimus]BDB98751.1 hypothetical protein SACC_17680 [Saccharolobus caldissimus]